MTLFTFASLKIVSDDIWRPVRVYFRTVMGSAVPDAITLKSSGIPPGKSDTSGGIGPKNIRFFGQMPPDASDSPGGIPALGNPPVRGCKRYRHSGDDTTCPFKGMPWAGEDIERISMDRGASTHASENTVM